MISAEEYKKMCEVAEEQTKKEREANSQTYQFKQERIDFHLKHMVAGGQPPRVDPGRAPLTQQEVEQSDD